MDKEKLLRRLKAAFLGELDERVRALNQDLQALEAADDVQATSALVNSIFRSAHSLKGAARAVGENKIEKTCHRLEEAMSSARDKPAVFAPAEVKALFGLVDSIEDAAAAFRKPTDTVGRETRPPEPLSPSPSVVSVNTAEADDFRPPMVGGKIAAVPPLADALADSDDVRPAPARLPASGPRSGSGMTSRTLRVSAEKLDSLLTKSGELVIRGHEFEARLEELEKIYDELLRLDSRMAGRTFATNAVDQGLDAQVLREGLRALERRFERFVSSLNASARAVNRASRTVNGSVRQLRMLPFAEACHSLRRIVRDLTAAGDKDVELVVTGGDVELDRIVLDGVADALRHIVRNALDHGIEPRIQRTAAGKSSRARIEVGATLRDTQVEIEVRDDGRGLDLKKIGSRAAEIGFEHLNATELAGLIFSPGFTTKGEVTSISGRGVGLDAVRAQMEALHGRVSVSSEPGVGTVFTLIVPLTLTTLRALVVSAAGQHFAIASTHVERLVRIKGTDVWTIQGRDVVDLGRPIPVASLGGLMKLPATKAMEPDAVRPAIVVSAAAREVAIVVDELIAEHQVVVKQLGPRLNGLRNVSGGTILPAGDIAFIVNVAQLLRTALDAGDVAGPKLVGEQSSQRKLRLLVADDSVTTRSLIVSILASAGYDVTSAVDGLDAWEKLQRQTFDLVVSDVEMPRLTGFELTDQIRSSGRSDLPVILVTTLDKDEDKLRGMEVGANAYIVKRGFDNVELLETIADLT